MVEERVENAEDNIGETDKAGGKVRLGRPKVYLFNYLLFIVGQRKRHISTHIQ